MRDINVKYLNARNEHQASLMSNVQCQMLGLFLIILLHVFLLSRLNFFPYPELFVYPYLTNNGLLPYQQILDQHFPGLLFTPINFGILGLNNASDARLWQFGLVLITQLVLFFVSNKVLKSRIKALLVTGLYLLWQPFLQGWMLWINNFLPALYLLAFYFAFQSLEKTKNLWRNIALTGLVFGIVVVFKQVALPVAGLVFLWLFFLHRNFKTWLYYGVSFLLPVLGMFGWLAWMGVLKDFWFWTIQFNLTTYARLGGKGPTLGELVRLFVVYLPTICLFFQRKGRTLQVLLGIFIFGGMFGGGHRFDLTYFQPALPFVCLAAILVFQYIYQKLGKVGLAVILGYLLISLVFVAQFYKQNFGSFVYYFDSETVRVAVEVKAITSPQEEIFVFGATPLLYQMTQTMPAGKVFVFQFPWFLVDSGDRIFDGLVKSNPRVIVSDPTTQTDNQKITDFAPKIYNYIYSRYHVTAKVGTMEVLERNKE